MADENTQGVDFDKKLSGVISFIRDSTSSEEDKQGLVQDLVNVAKSSQEDFVSTINEMSDSQQITNLKSGDSTFTAQSAFVQGVGRTATAGLLGVGIGAVKGVISGKGAKAGIEENLERERLLAKEFPSASGAGDVTGIFVTSGIGAVSGKIGLSATRATANAIKSLGGKGNFLRNATVALSSAVGAGGVGGIVAGGIFTGGTSSVREGTQFLLGKQDAAETAEKIKQETINTAQQFGIFGASFAVGGLALVQSAKAASGLAQKGVQFARKTLSGQETFGNFDAIEMTMNAFKNTPSAVLSGSAKEIAKQADDIVAGLNGELNKVKTELTNQIKLKAGDLDRRFINTADALNTSLEQLKASTGDNIIASGRIFNQRLGSAYTTINSAYGTDLKAAIVSAPLKTVNASGFRDLIIKELKAVGAMTKAGINLESQWVKTNPELAGNLAGFLERVNLSPTRLKTLSIDNAILLKRELGELANFGSKPTNYERFMGNLYHSVKSTIEKSVPALKSINSAYTKNRSKIDTFRSVVGKTESQISAKLFRDLKNKKNTFVVEAFEGLGEIAGTGEQVQKALGVSERMNLLSGLQKNPKQVFATLRRAYVNGDEFTMSFMDRAAQQFPDIKKYVDTAKQQGAIIQQLKANSNATRALEKGQSVEDLVSLVPGADKLIQKGAVTRAEIEAIRGVIPEGLANVEAALSRSGFASLGAQREQLSKIAAQNPNLAKALAESAGARTANKIKRLGRGSADEAVRTGAAAGGAAALLKLFK